MKKRSRKQVSQSRTPHFSWLLGVNLSVPVYIINGLMQLVAAGSWQPKTNLTKLNFGGLPQSLVKPVTSSSFNILIGALGMGAGCLHSLSPPYGGRRFSNVTAYFLISSQTLEERGLEKVKSTQKRSLCKTSNKITMKVHRQCLALAAHKTLLLTCRPINKSPSQNFLKSTGWETTVEGAVAVTPQFVCVARLMWPPSKEWREGWCVQPRFYV